MKKILLFSFLLLFVSLSASYAANEPYVISFQGRLTSVSDPSSVPITFRLFDALNGGNQMWEESHSIALEEGGIFNILLGQDTPLAEPLNDAIPLWLEVEADGAVLTPRQALTSSPYAFSAKNLRGGDAKFNTNTTLYGSATVNEGMMMYNGARHKLAYSDGSKWIEIDPVYTEKPINSVLIDAVPIASGGGDYGSGSATLFTAPAGGSIITNVGMCGFYSSTVGQPCKIRIKVDGNTRVEFFAFIYNYSVKMDNRIHYTLPIPIKVNADEVAEIEILYKNNVTNSSASQVYVNYINLPL